MKKQITVGVIGCGYWGPLLVRNFKSLPDCQLKAVCDLKTDFADERAPAVATEVCGTSITSQGPSAAGTAAAVARNPHVRFANSDKRGYVTVELSQAQARIALRTLDDVKQRESGIATLATFVIADGRPGAQPA